MARCTVGVSVLKRLQDAQCLLGRSSNSVIVDLNAPHDTLRINDEQTSKRGPVHIVVFIINQHTVGSGDLFANIGD